MKKILFTTFIFLVALNTACPTSTEPSGNSNTASNVSTTSPANIPEEFSNKPITPSVNPTPGIPDAKTANLSNMPKGATPTPGIPDPKNIGKTPVPKGATPTPGIPDEKILKEQRDKPVSNKNVELPKTKKDLEKKVNDALKNIPKPN